VAFEVDDFEYLRILAVGVQFVVFMVFKLCMPSKFNESCILGCNYVYMMWLSGHATIAGLCMYVYALMSYMLCVYVRVCAPKSGVVCVCMCLHK
jgi:hypothetical protein